MIPFTLLKTIYTDSASSHNKHDCGEENPFIGPPLEENDTYDKAIYMSQSHLKCGSEATEQYMCGIMDDTTYTPSYLAVVQEDAAKLLSHAFSYNSNSQLLMRKFGDEDDESPNQAPSSPMFSTQQATSDVMEVAVDNMYNNEVRVKSTFQDFSKELLQPRQMKCVPSHAKDPLIWHRIQKVENSTLHGGRYCDMCQIASSTTSSMPAVHSPSQPLSCCRLNVFKSLLTTVGANTIYEVFPQIRKRMPSADEMDKMMTMMSAQPIETTINNNGDEKRFLEHCKLLWRQYYHKERALEERAELCNMIDKKARSCIRMAKYALKVAANLLKIVPGSRTPSEQSFRPPKNPISYSNYPQLSKLHARFLALIADTDHVVAGVQRHYYAMLPLPLASQLHIWAPSLVAFVSFMRTHTHCEMGPFTEPPSPAVDRYLYKWMRPRNNSSSFHYCDYFQSTTQLTVLAQHVDEIHTNLLYAPFILNYCAFVCKRRISRRCTPEFGFDPNLMPEVPWNHPFPKEFPDIDQVVQALIPHFVE